jgi:hypothetical protein
MHHDGSWQHAAHLPQEMPWMKIPPPGSFHEARKKLS